MTDKDWIDVGSYFYERGYGWGERDLVMESNYQYAKDYLLDMSLPESEYEFLDGHLYVKKSSEAAEWARETIEELENYPVLNDELLYELEDEYRLELCYEEAYDCADRFMNRDNDYRTKHDAQKEIAIYIADEMRECDYSAMEYPERESVIRGYRRFLWEWTNQNYKPRPFQSVVESMLGDGYRTYIRDGIRYTTNKIYSVLPQ